MSPLPGKIICSGDAHPPRVCCPVELDHYLRQATITLRRHSSRLNQVWCKNCHLAESPNSWKR